MGWGASELARDMQGAKSLGLLLLEMGRGGGGIGKPYVGKMTHDKFFNRIDMLGKSKQLGENTPEIMISVINRSERCIPIKLLVTTFDSSNCYWNCHFMHIK